jgi:LPXTG-motif cell wall-anchored protein
MAATAPPADVAPTRVQGAGPASTAARLPYTGADIVPVALLGLGLVLLGLGLLRGRGRHQLGG